MRGVSFLVAVLGLSSHLSSGVDYSKYQECYHGWDYVRHPYLVSVIYTLPPEPDRVWQRKYHKNRHGALLTTKSVLTRGQDLDGYPAARPATSRDVVDRLPRDMHACQYDTRCKCWNTFTACVYVNTRRPIFKNDLRGEYCGQNMMVIKVLTHPKYGETAIQNAGGLRQHWENIKFPWAVLILQQSIKLNDGQTIPPAMILPRTPLDLLYILRRVETMGETSKYCEYPHYETSRHGFRWYPPLAEDVTIRRMSDYHYPSEPERKNLLETMCFTRSAQENRRWEGIVLGDYGDSYEEEQQRKCNESLFEGKFENTFLLFYGPEGSFVSRASPDPVRGRTDDRLGAPIVCNGITIGMVSSWQMRGRGRKDVYVGTTLLRGYRWIIKMMVETQEKYLLRKPDDSPFLGEKYSFRRHNYPTRNYDRDLFEMSLNERIYTYSRSVKETNAVMGVVFSTILFYQIS